MPYKLEVASEQRQYTTIGGGRIAWTHSIMNIAPIYAAPKHCAHKWSDLFDCSQLWGELPTERIVKDDPSFRVHDSDPPDVERI